MVYPKPFMRLQEMCGMGLSKEFLMDAYRSKGQTFAQKLNPMKSNSPIVFDTVEFDKWMLHRCKAENASIQRK